MDKPKSEIERFLEKMEADIKQLAADRAKLEAEFVKAGIILPKKQPPLPPKPEAKKAAYSPLPPLPASYKKPTIPKSLPPLPTKPKVEPPKTPPPSLRGHRT